jgi:predicted nucleic acid-binding protein
MAVAIVDTGPLIAFFNRKEPHYAWACSQINDADLPLLVCEPVLAEATYLLARHPDAQDTLLEFVKTGVLQIAFRLDEHIDAVRALRRKYRDLPMSLADACIVRMAEIYDRHAVVTLDSDFSVYRKHGRVPLTLIQPS